MKTLHLIDTLEVAGAQTLLLNLSSIKKFADSNIIYSLRHVENKREFSHINVYEEQDPSRWNLGCIRKIKKIIIDHDISIIHAHLFKSKMVAWILKLTLKKPIKIVFHEHGEIAGSDTGSWIGLQIYKLLLRISSSSIDRIIAVSQSIKDELLQLSAYENSKIQLMFNCIPIRNEDNDALRHTVRSSNNRKFTIGFAGRLVKRKGWHDFLTAASLLRENNNFNFVMVGDGPERNDLEQEINRLAVNNLSYLGLQSDMTFFYESLDCLVISSHFEPFGLVALEAMSFGIPIIASNIGGLKEIISTYECGYFFSANDPTDLAKKIEQLFTNELDRVRFSRNGVKGCKAYSASHYVDTLETMYKGLIAER